MQLTVKLKDGETLTFDGSAWRREGELIVIRCGSVTYRIAGDQIVYIAEE